MCYDSKSSIIKCNTPLWRKISSLSQTRPEVFKYLKVFRTMIPLAILWVSPVVVLLLHLSTDSDSQSMVNSSLLYYTGRTRASPLWICYYDVLSSCSGCSLSFFDATYERHGQGAHVQSLDTILCFDHRHGHSDRTANCIHQSMLQSTNFHRAARWLASVY